MPKEIEISEDLDNKIKEAVEIKNTEALLNFIKPKWTKKYGWIATCDERFFIDYKIDEDKDICKLINKENREKIKDSNYFKYLDENEFTNKWNKINETWLNNNIENDKEFKYFYNNVNLFSNRKKLFTDLYPNQIMGDIDKAKIYLLNMNPSVSENNIYEEKILNSSENKEHQDQYNPGKNNSLYFILDKYKGTDGYDWWRNSQHFGGWIQWLALNILDKHNNSYTKAKKKAVSIISKTFCSVEAIPYHAFKLTNTFNNNLNNLPSFIAVNNYLNNKIANNNKNIILILRKNDNWDCTVERNNVFAIKNQRSAYFGPNAKKSVWVEKIKKILLEQAGIKKSKIS